ncbi:hypothetical protein BCV70DRAFT_199975 [Testicularia cyperi]|uniref:Uncharacterized protein n=1 Tax=Testicularia cyperi TaxID=1882483 RepID=A0A317XR31_9BASI|nr:hypothetical protein BCV70DRAFT_199975 [Testicularia cyperi]
MNAYHVGLHPKHTSKRHARCRAPSMHAFLSHQSSWVCSHDRLKLGASLLTHCRQDLCPLPVVLSLVASSSVTVTATAPGRADARHPPQKLCLASPTSRCSQAPSTTLSGSVPNIAAHFKPPLTLVPPLPPLPGVHLAV